ncbi:MAG: hypothetical protein MUP21_10670 [Dehalococcoidia bacterium]|nr:hypothetical protein [Dehalococcoidia bacterium]
MTGGPTSACLTVITYKYVPERMLLATLVNKPDSFRELAQGYFYASWCWWQHRHGGLLRDILTAVIT